MERRLLYLRTRSVTIPVVSLRLKETSTHPVAAKYDGMAQRCGSNSNCHVQQLEPFGRFISLPSFSGGDGLERLRRRLVFPLSALEQRLKLNRQTHI